ncbi:hypothetical protein Gotur_029591 [Gossypium turneri]
MIADEILYRCGDFDWVPLLGIWGAVGYAPLLVLRQYRSRQFIPATQRLAQCEFWYKGDNYKKKKLEGNKLRKGKNKAEEDLDSLKMDYKKLRLSMRTVELEKTSDQWRQETKEEKNRVVQWEKNAKIPRDRDHTMGEAVAQIREVTDHLQTLAV